MGYEYLAVPFRGWIVVREIGIGGFGKVYEIRRDQYGIAERSAMKVIAVPQDPNEINTYLRDGYSPETLRKMYNGIRTSVLGEYQTMARLKDCPNIIRCEDIQVVMDPDGIGSKIYIRMELLTPVRDYEKLQSFNEEEVIKLGSDICNMLVRCEEEGIVHRDIKPGNIMVSGRGAYKLGDFGIARSMDHTTMATRIGTINYMAPEVYLGRKYGHAADIYSLGLVLYWLLNNRRMPFFPQDDSQINDTSAFAAQEMRMIGTPVPQPVNGSARLSKVVLKALAYDPADRYQSALEFGNEIRSCLSAEKKSETSYVCENDITESSHFRENETTLEYSQNVAGVFPERGSLDKENELRRQYRKMYAHQRDPEEIKAKEEADRLERECKTEVRHIAVEKTNKKRKRTLMLVPPIIVACIALAFVLINVIIPKQKYNAAVELYNTGKYEEAIAAFTALDGYRDSAAKINEIKPKYHKQMLSDANVGSHVFWGSYEQDNNTSNGKEDIEWLVLTKEGNKILVVSIYALDCQQYHEFIDDVTWETCSLRKWLNGTFLRTSFSSEEQNSIVSSTVTADKNPLYNTSPGNNTTDKIFLLSITEADKYFSSDSTRRCQGTAYCYARGAYKDNIGNSWWWLRSPGNYSDGVVRIYSAGGIHAQGIPVTESGAVRPALWIDTV